MVDLKFDKDMYQHIVQYYDYIWMKNRGINIMDLFPELPFR